MTLHNVKVLLGVTGGIAAYKAADLVRRLKEVGAIVKVVMTPAATQFVTPLTFQALSGQRVHVDLLDTEAEAAMGHIELARWADMLLIAPASADFIARLSYGHANDLLSTLCLATSAPVLIAPAMNQQMWQSPITQENCRRLQQRGISLLGPASGSQACGETGAGRLVEPLTLVSMLQEFLQQRQQQNTLVTQQPFKNIHILVTAGGTREDIDPVRFISNRSSGKMGYALAQAAHTLGAKVTLISGKTNLPIPPNIDFISVYSAQDMYDAVLKAVSTADIFIATAAVADYRPKNKGEHKLKKTVSAELTIELERTPDILAAVASLENPPFTVGFAAETQNVKEYALDKLHRKKLNMIAANQVGLENSGFDSDNNALLVLTPNREITLALTSKSQLAYQLLTIVIAEYQHC